MVLDYSVNWLAILVSGIISMIIGSLWYGPLFGKTWIKLMGFSKAQMDKGKKMGMKGMAKYYFANFIAILVTAWILSMLIAATGLTGWTGGLGLGFWIWLGFIAPVTLGAVIWEGKPIKLYLINTVYWLVNLLVIGALLGFWR